MEPIIAAEGDRSPNPGADGRSYFRVMRPSLALSVGAALLLSACGSSQLKLQMTPRSPLSINACIEETRSFGGYSVATGHDVCRSGRDMPWYHGVLTNDGDGAYPACVAQGFDRVGKVVFNGPVSLMFGGFPAGLFAKGHRSESFDWFIDTQPSGRIVRYSTSCSVNDDPPI